MVSWRTRGEAWLNGIWYGSDSSLALRALVPLYRALRKLDGLLKSNKAPSTRSLELAPIVLVGNLTVGGSGKTPLVIHLVQQARAAGWQPGVITRGYGSRAARTKSVLLLDGQNTIDWHESGDEALLVHQRCQCKVAVSADRIAAARVLSKYCDLLICDDGLQNSAIPRDLEVLVIDGARRFGNKQLLPAGPLREPLPNELAIRFPWRVNNGALGAEEGEITMQLASEFAHNTATGEHRLLQSFERAHAIAGIGNPGRFYRMLEALGIEVLPVPVADHQALASEVWESLLSGTTPVLMTEKDALKYPPTERAWSVPVTASLAQPLWDELEAALIAQGFSKRPADQLPCAPKS